MIMALAILSTRAVAAALVLKNKTSNIDHPERLPPDEIRRRELGSKLVILTRTCYAVFIWAMKFCILAFYSRLVEQLRHYQRFIRPIWWLLVLTFMGSILSTYLECRPFNQYA
jgi:ABC-type Na+ efflux pump permease subunit